MSVGLCGVLVVSYDVLAAYICYKLWAYAAEVGSDEREVTIRFTVTDNSVL